MSLFGYPLPCGWLQVPHLRTPPVGLRCYLLFVSNRESKSPTKLTALTHGGGCACKLGADELQAFLSGLLSHGAYTHHRLMVGAQTSDDAGVWVQSPELALVQTVDFFTPVVDDPYDWGRISATNALSDVYAMGARPLTALQIVGWPRSELAFGALASVMKGGADTMAQAECVIVGGHSIDSPEPTYGFAVTGTAHPGRIITNAGAQPGDLIVLTKPLGVGIATTAIKRGRAGRALLEAATKSMTTLNDRASRAMLAAGVVTATDVTGFGLLGHLREVLVASGVGAQIDIESIPVLDGVLALAESGVFSGGSARNLASAADFTIFGQTPEPWRMVLADAQTSGGLLIFVRRERSTDLTSALSESGALASACIGEVTEGPAEVTVRF